MATWVAVNPQNPEHFYSVDVGTLRIYSSYDAGNTWDTISNNFLEFFRRYLCQPLVEV